MGFLICGQRAGARRVKAPEEAGWNPKGSPGVAGRVDANRQAKQKPQLVSSSRLWNMKSNS